MRRVMLCAPLAVLLSVGCGNDREEYEPPPTPEPSAETETAAAAAAGEETVENRVAAMIETNERTTFGIETRDPFAQPRPERPEDIGGGGTGVRPDCDVNSDPLGKTDINSLELMGLVTGTALPRAMFGNTMTQAVIVTEGARVGPDCSNQIVDIRDNEVVFQQLTMDESDRVETVISLNDDRIQTRFIQIENE